VGVPRIIETGGGNPGAYVQQGGFSTSIPTWASISTRFQPGVNDPYKIDSIYTGDWTSLGVTGVTFHRHNKRVVDPMERVTAVLLFAGCAPNRRCLNYQYEFVNYCSTVPATSY
jgi:hypothetical protein